MVKQNSPISEDSVREALDSFISPTTRLTPDHPLCTLLMVDMFLSNPHLPKIDNAREFAVHHLLIDFITTEYTRQRAVFNLSSPKNIVKLEDATREILEDVALDSLELMAWCVLYFIYVRVDFSLSLPALSKKIGLVARTLRRYRANGISKLTTFIIMKEWETRTTQQYTRIISQLPEVKPVRLIGRDAELERIQYVIQRKQNAHILISGAIGIGKSVLVQESIRTLLKSTQEKPNMHIEHLIWLDRPASIQEILDAVMIEIGIDSTQVNMRDYLMKHQMILVLDEVNALEPDSVDDLIMMFDSAIIFVLSNDYILLKNINFYCSLTELNYDNAVKFIRSLDPNSDRIDYVFQQVGGNPLAIRLFITNPDIEFVDLETSETIIRRVVATTIQTLTEQQYQVCTTLALLPDSLISIKLLGRYLVSWCEMNDLSALMQKHLLRVNVDEEPPEVRVSLLPIVRRYFEQQAIDVHITADFTTYIGTQIDRFPDLTLKTINHIIQNFQTDTTHVGNIARKLQKYPELKRSEVWYQFLNTYFNQPIEKYTSLVLDYAIALRRIGKWKQCDMVLEDLVRMSGANGKFELQVSATLELAILFRLNGHYHKAEHLLKRCTEMIARLENIDLYHQLLLELTQIALDKKQGAVAKQHLSKISPSERPVEWSILMAEAELLNNNFTECKAIIDESTRQITTRHDLGRLYSVLSCNFFENGNYDEAKHCAQTAIAYFTDEGNLYSLALARSQSNLGAILMREQRYSEAEILLQNALETQEIYNDKLGLEATRLNFRILQNYLSRSNSSGTV